MIQYVEQRTVDDGMAHGRAKETMKNLCVWDEEAQETRTLVKGKWTLRFDIDFEDSSRSFPSGQTVEFVGSPATVTDVTVSPLAFRVEIEQSGVDYSLKDSYKYLDGKSEALDSLDVVLKLKDGRELDLGYWAGGSVDGSDDGKTLFSKSDMFSEIIPIEDMESIVVCGTEIPLQ